MQVRVGADDEDVLLGVVAPLKSKLFHFLVFVTHREAKHHRGGSLQAFPDVLYLRVRTELIRGGGGRVEYFKTCHNFSKHRGVYTSLRESGKVQRTNF